MMYGQFIYVVSLLTVLKTVFFFNVVFIVAILDAFLSTDTQGGL
jgi:hypothetical protein